MKLLVYLQQVTLLVIVDQDLQLLQLFQVFLDLNLGVGQPLLQLGVVGVRDVQELGAASPQRLDGADDVVGPM